MDTSERHARLDVAALRWVSRSAKPIRTHGSCVKHKQDRARGSKQRAPKLKWLRVEVCPMSPGWAQALGSARVTRVVIATAGVATLVVGRAGVAMAAGPPIGTSVSTPAGKAAVSTTTGPSGASGNAQVTGAGPTHGTVPVNVNANTNHPGVTVNSSNPTIGTTGVSNVQVPAAPGLPSVDTQLPPVDAPLPDNGAGAGTPGGDATLQGVGSAQLGDTGASASADGASASTCGAAVATADAVPAATCDANGSEASGGGPLSGVVGGASVTATPANGVGLSACGAALGLRGSSSRVLCSTSGSTASSASRLLSGQLGSSAAGLSPANGLS